MKTKLTKDQRRAKWDTLSTTGRLQIIHTDSSMRLPRWQNLSKEMAAKNWDQLTSLQAEAVDSLMQEYFRYSRD